MFAAYLACAFVASAFARHCLTATTSCIASLHFRPVACSAQVAATGTTSEQRLAALEETVARLGKQAPVTVMQAPDVALSSRLPTLQVLT